MLSPEVSLEDGDEEGEILAARPGGPTRGRGRGGRRGGCGGGRGGRGGSCGGGRNGRGGRASESGPVGACGGSRGGVLAGERGSGRQRVGASADDREASTSAGQHRGLQRLRESVSSHIEDQPRATRRRLQ